MQKAYADSRGERDGHVGALQVQFRSEFLGHNVAFDYSRYLAHITALLRKDPTRICGEAGFSDVRLQFTNAGGAPKMPVVTWQQVSFGLLKDCRFSDNVIVTAVE